MVTDTLQDYEALLESGFSEDQARAVVRIVTPARSDPEALRRLDRIEQLLNTQSQVLEQHSLLLEQHSQMFQAILPLVQRIPTMEQEIAAMGEDIRESRANQHVIEERVKMEGRVSRLINATLIALGAIGASLVAALTR